MIFLVFLGGWCTGALCMALAIGAMCRAADRAMPTRQPTGVRDPETQLLWDETGVISGQVWTA